MGLKEKLISAYRAQKNQEVSKINNTVNQPRELTEEEKEDAKTSAVQTACKTTHTSKIQR